MDEDQNNAKERLAKTDKVKSTTKNHRRKMIIMVVLGSALLIGLAVWGTLWQNSKFNKLNSQIDELEQQAKQTATNSTQLTELSSQTDGLETNLSNLKGRIDEFLREQQEESERYEVNLEATVLETDDATLRVKEYDNNCYCTVEKKKSVKIVKVDLTNNSQVDVYFGTYSIAGITDSGKLIESVEVVPEDRKGQSLNFQLAPGGQAEAYVYIPDTTITGIYLNDTDESISF